MMKINKVNTKTIIIKINSWLFGENNKIGKESQTDNDIEWEDTKYYN